jgi:hypothetical protein
MPKVIEGAEKRHPLNMRTTKAVRERLEASARANGGSLMKDVEARIERSFELDDVLAEILRKIDALRVARLLAAAASP